MDEKKVPLGTRQGAFVAGYEAGLTSDVVKELRYMCQSLHSEIDAKDCFGDCRSLEVMGKYDAEVIRVRGKE